MPRPQKAAFSAMSARIRKGCPTSSAKITRNLFKIGLNPARSDKRPEAYVVVRHPPVAPQTFDAYVKDGLARFDDLPTWKPGFPHNIRRITRQNKACNNCHGNRALFLRPSDLEPWEIAANAKVVVPDERIPKEVDQAKE